MGAGAIRFAKGKGSDAGVVSETQQVGVRPEAIELILDIEKPSVGFMESGVCGHGSQRNGTEEHESAENMEDTLLHRIRTSPG